MQGRTQPDARHAAMTESTPRVRVQGGNGIWQETKRMLRTCHPFSYWPAKSSN
jgi:hypothetical protein